MTTVFAILSFIALGLLHWERVRAGRKARQLQGAARRLRLLARWFDAEQRKPGDGKRCWLGDEVQRDLRRWAEVIEELR